MLIDPQSGRIDVLEALGDRVSDVRDTDDGGTGVLRHRERTVDAVTARLPNAPSAIGPRLAIAPDRRHAVIRRAESPSIDLMLAPAR